MLTIYCLSFGWYHSGMPRPPSLLITQLLEAETIDSLRIPDQVTKLETDILSKTLWDICFNLCLFHLTVVPHSRSVNFKYFLSL